MIHNVARAHPAAVDEGSEQLLAAVDAPQGAEMTQEVLDGHVAAKQELLNPDLQSAAHQPADLDEAQAHTVLPTLSGPSQVRSPEHVYAH